MSAKFGCVLLTMGRRPAELDRAVRSLSGQQGVTVDLLVVGNGWDPTGLPEGTRTLALRENVGIPAGRNAGVTHVAGDFLMFLDDDASLPSPDALCEMAARFDQDPELGMIQPRVRDPDGRPSPRRWVPRLRVGDEGRSSDVVAVWEGAVAMPRAVFDATGGWPACFWYGHEGIDLAWRVWEQGYRVRYCGDLVVNHPVVDQSRHAHFQRYFARNRVWLARRNLPFPLALAYCCLWLVLGMARAGSMANVVEILRGYRLGVTTSCGDRHPIRWRTAWRMTLAGRPPVI